MSISKKIKVLFVSHTANMGGAERSLLNFVSNIDNQVFDPIVVCPKYEGKLNELLREMNVKYIECEYLLSFVSNKSFKEKASELQRINNEVDQFEKIMLEISPDAVVVNTGVLLPPVIAAARSKIPCLLHSHGILSPAMLGNTYDFSFINLSETILYSLVDKVIVPSMWVKNHIVTNNKMSDSMIEIIPNATMIDQKCSQTILALSPIPRISMLCTLESNKNVLMLLEAALELKNQGRKAIFDIYGDGVPDYKQYLEKFISNYELEDMCFLHSKTSNVNDVYRSSLCTVVASNFESFSYIVIESFANKTPVISTKCGGPEEIITHGNDGFLIEKNNYKELAKYIVELMDNSELAKEMGKNGFLKVNELYDIKKVVKSYEQQIKNLMQKKIEKNYNILNFWDNFIDFVKGA